MKILVIGGSVRTPSRTRMLAKAAADLLRSCGAEVLYFDAGVNRLPLFAGKDADRDHPEVVRLLAYAEQADGFFVCTPDYHNGMSGALKNALDFLGSAHFKGKPAAIAACSGGGKGGINPLNHLRLVLRGVYAMVLPDQFVADPSDFDAQGEFAAETGRTRLSEMAKELVRLTGLLKP